MGEVTGHSPNIAGSATAARPASVNTARPTGDAERILLLECRLEQAHSALEDARAEADRLRVRLAEAAAREADHARRYSTVHQELAEARAEIVSLHEALDRSEAQRAELEGHLFESGARDDAAELIRLRREVLAQRDRCLAAERAASRLRTRVDDLLQSREALLSRVATWQRLIRQDGPEAVDLAEFMAELRRDILDLEHRNAAGEQREAALRERLLRAGMDPGVEPSNAHSSGPSLVVSYRESEDVEHTRAPADPASADDDVYLLQPIAVDDVTSELEAPAADVLAEDDEVVMAPPEEEKEEERDEDVIVLDDVLAEAWYEDVVGDALIEAAEEEQDVASAQEEVVDAAPVEEPDVDMAAVASPGGAAVAELNAFDPDARAAAYGRMVPLLEGDRLADHLRAGLADPHPRVRRRTVLAAAAARSVPLHPLLDPLRTDPDPQVRRVVREVLRHATVARPWSDARQDTA